MRASGLHHGSDLMGLALANQIGDGRHIDENLDNGHATLIVGPNAAGTYALVSHGYQSAADTLPAIDQWLSGVRAAAS